MRMVDQYGPLVARILLAAIFLMSGWNKITGFEGTVGFVGTVLPMATFFALAAIVLEVVGGLSVLLGYRAEIGAALLILFTVPATILFHNFWAMPPEQMQMQMLMFMKNLGILAGLIMVMSFGSGPMSMDKKKAE